MPTKAQRHHRITTLLARGPIPSQDELQAALQSEGIAATQATLSRDLKDLGAVKGPQGYTLPEMLHAAAPSGSMASAIITDGSPRLHQAVRDFVAHATTAGNLVVLKTGPGHAQVVALELDRSPPAGVVGTIAGDDTIFIAAKTTKDASRVLGQLKNAAALN